MKYLIFDAGPIISLTMNGMLSVLEKLKEQFDGRFIITPPVKREIIDSPMKIKKYKLEALQVQNLLDKGVLEESGKYVQNNLLVKETAKILKQVNGILRSTCNNEKIKILHEGEASCMAFANLTDLDNVIVIDERTTRMLTESPQNLKKMMEQKLHCSLTQEDSLLNTIKHYKYIRSTELMYVAFQKNLFSLKKDKNFLDAILYALKFKGTAISSKEIEAMKKLV